MSEKKKCVSALSLKSSIFTNSSDNWLCKIDSDYLQSQVSYYGLNKYVDGYTHCAYIIRGKDYDISTYSEAKIERIKTNARLLYGLLHQRFILTEEGCSTMEKKYNKGIFGRCPRIKCENEKLLPIGSTTVPNTELVKTFCPRCFDIYETKAKYDAAFFGPDFPMMFIKHMSIRRVPRVFYLTEESKDGAPNNEHRLVRYFDNKYV